MFALDQPESEANVMILNRKRTNKSAQLPHMLSDKLCGLPSSYRFSIHMHLEIN